MEWVLYCRQVLNVLTVPSLCETFTYKFEVATSKTVTGTLPPGCHLTYLELGPFRAKVQVTRRQRACHDPPIDVPQLPQLKQLHATRPFTSRWAQNTPLSAVLNNSLVQFIHTRSSILFMSDFIPFLALLTFSILADFITFYALVYLS